MLVSPRDGVLVSGQSLVLQGVQRGRAGHYQCGGSNGEGRGTSEQVLLAVQCTYFIKLFFPCFHYFSIFSL